MGGNSFVCPSLKQARRNSAPTQCAQRAARDASTVLIAQSRGTEDAFPMRRDDAQVDSSSDEADHRNHQAVQAR
jgi:hypothetical protein